MIKNFKELISQLKAQVPIQELISEFATVKRSGRGYVTLCPFHDDHHPSLQIHPQKGIFKCFACGTGGDLITFYSLITKKKYSEVIPELALKYGLKVEYGNENQTETKIKQQLYELNKAVLDFFKRNLFENHSKEVLNYLKDTRKLSDETIEKYEIGFAQNSWDALYNFLTKQKLYPQELIIASGLFVVKENDQGYYDRFRNRIILPIVNENNQIIGFGGRILPSSDENSAKYINSPETLIFNKGQNVYGLNFAKEEIKKEDYVILTEGYFDVITAHQNNLLNTVATLGTAFTMQQARLLIKHTDSKKICLCLDTDMAGKRALESIFKLTQEISDYINMDLRVVTNLTSKDLDESIKTEGSQSIKNKTINSPKLTYFIFDKLAKEYSESQNEITKKTVFDEITETIISIKDKIEQKEITKYLSHKLSLEEELINFKLKAKTKSINQKVLKYQKANPQSEDETFKMHTSERFRYAEIELLSLYLCSFPHKEEIKAELSQIEFQDEKYKLIKDFLDGITTDNLNSKEVLEQLMFEFSEFKHIMSVITDLAWRTESDETSYAKNKIKILSEAKLWIKWWITNKQKMKSLQNMLKECKNTDEETKILTQMIDLVKKGS